MINELFTERYLDGYLGHFQKDKKVFNQSRYLHGVAFMLVYLLFVLIFGGVYMYLLAPLFFYLGYKYVYFRLIRQRNKELIMVSYLFPEFLQVFMAMLSTTGNIYQTLSSTVEYTSEPLKGRLKHLIRKIGEGNDRRDYMNFAEYIGSSEAIMVMDKIYQFSEYGVDRESLRELQAYIQSLQENKVDELIERKIGSMENYGLLPLFISMILVGGFTVVIFWHYGLTVLFGMDIL